MFGVKSIATGLVVGLILGSMLVASPVGASGFRMDSDLEDSQASFWGEDASDYAGISVAGAGDVNGDGYDDILIGAYGDDDGGSYSGQTYLFLGNATGLGKDIDLSGADASFWGEDTDDYSGYCIAGAGDVNGDGYDDIIIGAYGDDDGGANAGQTYLILGKVSGWAMDTDLSTADASFWGEDAGDMSGMSVAGAGDVNSDGYDDFLIGAIGDDDGGSEAGQTYLLLGKASGWAMDTDLSAASASFWGEAAFDRCGFSVTGAGDVNWDGYGDILIGAYTNDDGGADAGQSYLILGKASGWAMDTDLSAASASFWGEDADDVSGVSVAGAGDVNGDGYDDLLIGAFRDEDGGFNAGQTYLILGKASGWAMDVDLSNVDSSFWGEDADDYSGISVAGAGDVNGDGYDDILVGAYGDDDRASNAGQTYLIKGKASGWAMDTDLSKADASFRGEGADDFSGYRVAGAKDVNRDGYDDILIGAFRNDEGGTDAGQAYLVFYEIAIPAAPRNLEARLSGNARAIGLGWDPVQFFRDISGYEIFRSNDGISYSLLARVNGATLSYTDTKVVLGRTYCYRMAATSFPDLVSPLSEAVAVFNDIDTDMDNMGNRIDYDDDNDGIPDELDAQPLVKDDTRWYRTDIDLANYGTGFVGEDAGDWSGYSVAGAGDVNGDGYDDILIGAIFDDDGGEDAGQTYLFFGKASGWAADTDLSAASASFWGEDAGDYSGCYVAGAGDVNGDGYDDFLIGAMLDDDGGEDAGQTYLIFGKASGWAMDTDLSAASASFWGEDAGDYSGGSVAGAGDVNGDGYNDILIGAFFDDDGGADAGQSYLILGKASGWAMDTDLSAASASFWGEDSNDWSGYSVAGAKDVNGDGYDDILIGAVRDDDGGGDAGQTYLILGKASGWAMDADLSTAGASFWGEDTLDLSGGNVAGAGDVNGDGYDDILVGAYQDDDGGADAGQAYLILGKASGWAMDIDLSAVSASFWGEDAGDYAGASVAGAGDVNADGFDDILIGAMYDDDGGADAGQTYLVLGKASGWAMDTDLSAASVSFVGEDSGDLSGRSVASAGDVNGDGFDDIIISAMYDDDGGSNAGQTYLVNRTVLSPVQGLSLNLTSAMTGVQVSWTKDHSDPFFYGIYRGAAPDMLYRLGTTNASSYVDTNIIAGVTYYYSVSAVGPLGEESPIAAARGMVADLDTDGDGRGNMVDSDDDNDGVPDGQDGFPLSSTETLDTDRDGIGNNADADDDNDGIPDVNDTEPMNPLNTVISHLSYANATLQTIQGTVNTIRTDLTLMDSNLTSLSAGFMAAEVSLTDLLNGLDADIVAFNQSMQGRLDTVVKDLSGFNFSVQGRLGRLDANVSGINISTQNKLNDLGTDIAGFNQSVQGRMTTLADAIAILSAQLDEVNASLSTEMSAIASEMDAFRKEMRAGLQDMLDLLAQMDANLTGIGSEVAASNASINSGIGALDSRLAGHIQGLGAMINDLNATTINEMRRQLGDLRSSMEATAGNESARVLERIDSLNGIMGGFQSSTNGHFNNISIQMARLDGIKSDIGGLRDQQEKTEKNVGTVMNLSYLPIVLIIIVLLLVAVLLMRSGRKKDPPAPKTGSKPLDSDAAVNEPPEASQVEDPEN